MGQSLKVTYPSSTPYLTHTPNTRGSLHMFIYHKLCHLGPPPLNAMLAPANCGPEHSCRACRATLARGGGSWAESVLRAFERHPSAPCVPAPGR